MLVKYKKRAEGRTRTGDIQITNLALYQLSYIGLSSGFSGILWLPSRLDTEDYTL